MTMPQQPDPPDLSDRPKSDQLSFHHGREYTQVEALLMLPCGFKRSIYALNAPIIETLAKRLGRKAAVKYIDSEHAEMEVLE